MDSETPKKSRLDTAANIAIIVVAVAAIVVLIPMGLMRWREFLSPQPSQAPPPMVEKGERFDQLKAILPSGASRALVVAVSPGCHFCNESMPFYKQLLDRRNQKSSGIKFIAAVPTEEAKAEEAQKFASAGAAPDGLVQLDFAAVKVFGTPTLMLVDDAGVVLGVWVGKLDESRQKEVLEVL